MKSVSAHKHTFAIISQMACLQINVNWDFFFLLSYTLNRVRFRYTFLYILYTVSTSAQIQNGKSSCKLLIKINDQHEKYFIKPLLFLLGVPSSSLGVMRRSIVLCNVGTYHLYLIRARVRKSGTLCHCSVT